MRWLCSFLAIVSLNREPLLLFKVLNLIEHGKSAFPMQLLLAWLFISQRFCQVLLYEIAMVSFL